MRNFNRTTFVEKLWGLVSAASRVEATLCVFLLVVRTLASTLALTLVVGEHFVVKKGHIVMTGTTGALPSGLVDAKVEPRLTAAAE